MRRRVLTALGIAVIGMPAILLGGPVLFLVLGAFIVGAAWEYVHLFRAIGTDPDLTLVVGGVAAVLAVRMFAPAAAQPVLIALVLAALVRHSIAFERGRERAGVDFALTLGGILYLGWVGAYLLDVRNLPRGEWWFMLILPCVMMADTGGYTLGTAYGRHKLAPRLSPNKSWEGYAAGVFTGVITGAFLAWAYASFGNLGGLITPLQGAVLGLALGALTPLGDLGESMLKRQSGLKDSSDIMPGHGGFFDRIDSWLWGGALGYFFLIWFVL